MNDILVSDRIDILIHSGTKGMKWGTRLYQYQDGSLTPLGRIHYGVGARKEARKERRAIRRNADKKKYYEDKNRQMDAALDVLEEMASKNEKLKSALDDEKEIIKKTEEIIKDYKKNVKEYQSLAGVSTSLYYEDYGADTLDSITQMASSYLLGDGDQGSNNSLGLYLNEKGILNDAKDMMQRSYRNKKVIANELFEARYEIGGKKYRDGYFLADYGDEERSLNMAVSEYKTPSSIMRSCIDEGKKILSKIDKNVYSEDENGWDKVNEASKKLGLDDVPTYKLTDSDWDRINAEVRSMSHSDDSIVHSAIDIIVHSGTKGMKWYRRLYQYPDGSLTPLGRIHRAEREGRTIRGSTKDRIDGIVKKANSKMSSLDKKSSATAKKLKSEIDNFTKKMTTKIKESKAEKDKAKAQKKYEKDNPYSKYTDQQLKDMTTRLTLEKNYRDAYNIMHPKKQMDSKIKEAFKEVGTYAIKTGGKAVVNKITDSILGPGASKAANADTKKKVQNAIDTITTVKPNQGNKSNNSGSQNNGGSNNRRRRKKKK